MTIGEKLAEIRSSKGLNKSEVARQLGIASQLYGQYERGEVNPKVNFYKKYKEVFGVDLDIYEDKSSSTSQGGTTGQPTGGTIEDESDLGEEKPRTAFSKERIEQILKDQERKPSVTLYDEFSLRLIGWTLWEAFLNERLEQLDVDIPEKVSWCRRYAAEYYAQRLLEAQQPDKDGS